VIGRNSRTDLNLRLIYVKKVIFNSDNKNYEFYKKENFNFLSLFKDYFNV